MVMDDALLPMPERDVKYYKNCVESNFEKFVEYYNLFYFRRDDKGNVMKNKINIDFIWEHIVSLSYDNANQIAIDAISSKLIDEKDFESYSDKFVGASLEAIIDNVISG